MSVSDFFKEYGFVVGALTGSLAAYLLGLLISHVRREKRWLGWAVDSRSIINSQRPDLTIAFKGQPIAKLDSHTVLLRNIGNRPLTDLPVRIITDPQARILEQEIKAPDGIGITTTISNDIELHLIIDLLNPKEAVGIDLTISDSSSGEIQVLARVAGLSLIELSERSVSATEMLDIFAPVFGNFVANILRLMAKAI